MVDFNSLEVVRGVVESVKKAVADVGDDLRKASFFSSSQAGKTPVYVVTDSSTDIFYGVAGTEEEAKQIVEVFRDSGTEATLEVTRYLV